MFARSSVSTHAAFCDPITRAALDVREGLGLVNGDGVLYKFAEQSHRVVDFVEPLRLSEVDSANLDAYDSEHAAEIYRNFLAWLFETFGEHEETFRRDTLEYLNLSQGMKVLVTGCGLGEDLSLILEQVGTEGEVHAQDISRTMVLHACSQNHYSNILFSVSNANTLPYASRYFDAVFHFGGINLFGDVGKAIRELERVCKIGGRVLFGDEGIAPHLRGDQYAAIAINNNRLWAAEAPMHLLPKNAVDIVLRYVLGNCFYLISFTPTSGLPKMNIDVPHKGSRGGSARTRYFGQLEGVTQSTKEKIVAEAKTRNLSVHQYLEEVFRSTTRSA